MVSDDDPWPKKLGFENLKWNHEVEWGHDKNIRKYSKSRA